MGTRSLTHVIDDDFGRSEHLCTIYRQYDGYPEGHGKDVVDFITSREFVSGYNYPLKQFNGAGCFAAALVAHLKTKCNGSDGDIEAGGVYLHAPNLEAKEEYNYTITIAKGEVSLKVESWDSTLFEGSPMEFDGYLKGLRV